MASNTSTPRGRCDELLAALMPFAEQMLTKYGEFYPFGAAMKVDGSIELVSGGSEAERPNADELIEITREAFRQGAAKGKYSTTGLAVNLRVQLSDNSGKQDAVGVFLDDRDEYSIVVYFPYQQAEDKTIAFGDAVGQQGESLIFGGSSERA